MFDQPKQSIGFKFFQNYAVYLLLFVECTTVHSAHTLLWQDTLLWNYVKDFIRIKVMNYLDTCFPRKIVWDSCQFFFSSKSSYLQNISTFQICSKSL